MRHSKLANTKEDGIGEILSGKGRHPSKPYIPGILSSDILSKPRLHFIKEHTVQPHVDKHARVRPRDARRRRRTRRSQPRAIFINEPFY